MVASVDLLDKTFSLSVDSTYHSNYFGVKLLSRLYYTKVPCVSRWSVKYYPSKTSSGIEFLHTNKEREDPFEIVYGFNGEQF